MTTRYPITLHSFHEKKEKGEECKFPLFLMWPKGICIHSLTMQDGWCVDSKLFFFVFCFVVNHSNQLCVNHSHISTYLVVIKVSYLLACFHNNHWYLILFFYISYFTFLNKQLPNTKLGSGQGRYMMTYQSSLVIIQANP